MGELRRPISGLRGSCLISNGCGRGKYTRVGCNPYVARYPSNNRKCSHDGWVRYFSAAYRSSGFSPVYFAIFFNATGPISSESCHAQV